MFFILSVVILAFGYGNAGAQSEPEVLSNYAVYSTGQFFQKGVMLWRADTGFIWALANDGQVYNFPLSAYTELPENRNRENLTYPALFGFGKVWANNWEIRSQFGFPIWQEFGFNMGVHQDGETYYLRQTNGTIYKVMPDGTWEYAEEMPNSGTPIIYSFEATPNPASAGTSVYLNWSAAGAEAARIEAYAGDLQIISMPDLALAGSSSFKIPSDVATAAIEFWLHLADPDAQRLVSTNVLISVAPSEIYENNPGATFQQFERGFMIWRADTNDIYVLYGANGGPLAIYPGSAYSGLPDNPIRNVPLRRVRPENGFGKVWGNIPQVRNQIGWATVSEDGYLATARLENGVPIWITIPDGRAVILTEGAWAWAGGEEVG
jgi:hypothetical protein